MVTPSDERTALLALCNRMLFWNGVISSICSLSLAIRQFGLGLYFLSVYNHPLLGWSGVLTGGFWMFVCILSGCLVYLNCSSNCNFGRKAARRMWIAWIVAYCLIVLFVVYDILATVLVSKLREELPDGGFSPYLLVFSGWPAFCVLCPGSITIFALGSIVRVLDQAKPAMDPEYGATADAFIYPSNDPKMQHDDTNMQRSQPTMQYQN